MIETTEAWLRGSAVRLHDEAPRLTALDQAIGDGDHGINLDRGFAAITAALDGRTGAAPVSGSPDGSAGGGAEGPGDRAADLAATADLLRLVGRTLISTVGGASGPLYGTAFLKAAAATGAAAAAAEPPSGGQVIAAALEAAATGVATLGKATTGEKTMLDALEPAARAARSAADEGAAAATVAAAAREAAARGAEATIPLLATKGRASYLGERSIGHQDPGATSLAALLDVLATTLG